MLLRLTNTAPFILQLTVIVLISLTASYVFQHTESTLQLDGISIFNYLAYSAAIFLGFLALSCHKKAVGLVFSITLLVLVLSPIRLEAIKLFPTFIPFLTVLMGITTMYGVRSSRGRGFFELLAVLILPAVLAESRVGGSFQLLAIVQSVGHVELSAAVAAVVGGYFYLRYAKLTNQSYRELLSSGADRKDLSEVNVNSTITTALVVITASLIATGLMSLAPVAAFALQNTVAVTPLHVILLATGAGMSITLVVYIFSHSQENNHQKQRRNYSDVRSRPTKKVT